MRKFLVVLDDSRECLNAMRFAAMRASNTGGGVQVLAVIPPEEFNHWIGVGEIMRAEARERIEVHYEVFAKWMRDKQGVDPELIIREGEAVPEIIDQIRTDPEIGVLVLGAGVDKKGPGPLVSQMSRSAAFSCWFSASWSSRVRCSSSRISPISVLHQGAAGQLALFRVVNGFVDSRIRQRFDLFVDQSVQFRIRHSGRLFDDITEHLRHVGRGW